MEEMGNVNTAPTDAVNTDQSLAEKIEAGSTEGFSSEELNRRLLDESKLNKRKYLESRKELLALRNERDEAEKTRLESQQEWKTAYENASSELTELRKERVTHALKSAVVSLATKEGCQDVESLMKIGDDSLLHIDPTSGEVLGVDLFVEKTKREKPWLFASTKTASVNTALPSGNSATNVVSDDLSKLSDSELKARIAAIDKK